MDDLLLIDVKQKLATVRRTCPGMSDELYLLTDYMSLVANDELTPSGVGLLMILVRDDIEKGRNGFRPNEPLPEIIQKNRRQILTQFQFIPQVIDVIANEEFANEFRKECKEILNIDPPRRVNASEELDVPENIKVAVEWWANAIQSPKLDNGDMNPLLLMMASSMQKSYTEEEIALFKQVLADEISHEIERRGGCILDVDYHPCMELANAGDKIGVDRMGGYPWKTTMWVYQDRVSVSDGYGSPQKVLWEKEKGLK